MEWKNWLSVLLSDRRFLPECSGIYVVADINDFVWYVGQAANIKSRWTGRAHHRYPQLIRSNRKLCYRIYWKEISPDQLNAQEKYYIDLFNPELNSCKVKKYLPNNSQVEREIKRLLKVINKITTIFTVIRSVIVGEYLAEDDQKSILILINGNDYEIISKSMRKRYAKTVQKAWRFCTTYCGREEQQYQHMKITRYTFGYHRFDFLIISWGFFQSLTENSELFSRYISIAELFGVQVKALKKLTIFDELSLKSESEYTNLDGKIILTSLAYINYCKPSLKCIINNDL